MRRIIVVGLGGMGAHWATHIAESGQWEAAAYVDVSEQCLRTQAELHGMPRERCFTDVRAALDAVPADAVLDATPQQARRAVCHAALERGLHVLAEKPMADTLENARFLADCAARRRRTLMIAQNYRYQPEAQTAREFLTAGGLGPVGYVSIQFFKGPHFGGYREEMAYPLLLDMSIHHFDLIRCFLQQDIAAVTVTSINAPWNWNQGDATVMAHLETEGGAAVSYVGSWVSQGWETTWNGDWRFEGPKGVLLWRNGEVAFSAGADTKEAVPLVEMPAVHQARLLEVFAECLDHGAEPETSGRRNLNSLAAIYAAVRSAKERRRVQVDELLQ